jgi:hypothetical protein
VVVQAGERLSGAHNAQMGHGADAREGVAAKRCRRLTVGDVERHSTYGSNKGERTLRKQLGGVQNNVKHAPNLSLVSETTWCQPAGGVRRSSARHETDANGSKQNEKTAANSSDRAHHPVDTARHAQ